MFQKLTQCYVDDAGFSLGAGFSLRECRSELAFVCAPGLSMMGTALPLQAADAPQTSKIFMSRKRDFRLGMS